MAVKKINKFEELQSIKHSEIIYSLTGGKIYKYRKIERFFQFPSLVQLITEKDMIITIDKQMFEKYDGVFIEKYSSWTELIPILTEQLNRKYNSDILRLNEKQSEYGC